MLNYIPAALIILSVFVSVFVGILMNRHDVAALRTDMNRQFDKVDAHLTRIDEDLRRFYGTDKELEGRLNELSARIK